MMNIFKRMVLGLMLVLPCTLLPAAQDGTKKPDYGKETRWAEQIVDFLVDGDAIWLKAQRRKFLGIFTPAQTKNPVGAVILIHGNGVHPDWAQVIKPLRTSLPARGWATLSIQMPVLPNGAQDPEYVPLFKLVPPRVTAAVKYLHSQGIENIVLAGHSIGATMAGYYLAETQDKNIKAFVGIGMKAKAQPAQFKVLDNSLALRKIKVPVLDVYGSKTNKVILNSTARRAAAIKEQDLTTSAQVAIDGSDHFFVGYESQLYHTIVDFLAKAVVAENNTLSTEQSVSR